MFENSPLYPSRQRFFILAILPCCISYIKLTNIHDKPTFATDSIGFPASLSMAGYKAVAEVEPMRYLSIREASFRSMETSNKEKSTPVFISLESELTRRNGRVKWAMLGSDWL